VVHRQHKIIYLSKRGRYDNIAIDDRNKLYLLQIVIHGESTVLFNRLKIITVSSTSSSKTLLFQQHPCSSAALLFNIYLMAVGDLGN
jgi:hypothetical protein